MTVEDTLELYEARDGEIEELLWRVATLSRVRNHSGLTTALAQLRFEQSLVLLRQLDDEMHLAHGDLRIVTRRLRALIAGKRPLGGRRHELETCWIEFMSSCSTYRLFARRSCEAVRAALSLIFLH